MLAGLLVPFALVTKVVIRQAIEIWKEFLPVV